MQYKLIDIKSICAPEKGLGGLSFFESERDIPFTVKRFYYIYGVDADQLRGMHMHKQLRQLIFCPYGKIDMTLDDGYSRETICLDSPGKGLLIEPGLWREMRWVETDSVLCVAASDYYTEDDYIRNYDEFLEYVKENKK